MGNFDDVQSVGRMFREPAQVEVNLIEPNLHKQTPKIYRTFAEAERIANTLRLHCRDCDYVVKGSADGNRISIMRDGKHIGYIY